VLGHGLSISPQARRGIRALARYFAASFYPKSVAASEFGCVKIETNRMIGRTGSDPTNWPSSATAVSGSKHVKAAKLAPVFTALILMACHGPPSPPPSQAIGLPPGIGSGQGIDLPIDASDVLIELQQSRVDFVARYYREAQSRWPPLSASEAQRLSSLGLKIVAVWESHSRDPAHFSYSTGYYDAVTADQQARAIGQPAGSAIYFAVDFNARGQSLKAVDEYFRGIAAGLAAAAASGGSATYAVGVYGSGVVCDAIKRASLARYSWLSNSFAWEGSTSYDDWDIMQGGPSPELSFNQDSDEARADYGAFRIAGGAPAASSVRAGLGDAVSPQFPPVGQSLISSAASSR
jgi:hypothetical protein